MPGSKQEQDADVDRAKALASRAAFDLVSDGMCLALGTGSTVEAGLDRLAGRIASGLRVVCVSSSDRTSAVARRYQLPLSELENVQAIDILIDGADQIAPDFAMIKGRGGAVVREKKLAAIARKRVYIADVTKLVAVLGNTWLPVEVLPFGCHFTLAKIAEIVGGEARLRLDAGQKPILSDNGNYLADCRIGVLPEPGALAVELKMVPGVIETGLFVGLADVVITSDGNSVTVRQRSEQQAP